MDTCKNCKYHCTIDEIKTFPGGAQVVFTDGFGCTKRLQKDAKVSWYSESDDDTYCCDCFELCQ